MMEKRNFVTSYRTPADMRRDDEMLKEAEAFDQDLEHLASEFTRRAESEDEKSDRDHFNGKK